ncbi:MAG: dTDP-4-dehydrorhamnose reductase [Planctomycetaceae bacterium]|nr:dTDP-4-dehydrorhamnose reductase [Planctomycetaceae bacterium]
MPIAIIGAGGQLGRELAAGTDPHDTLCLAHRNIEISDPASIAAALDGKGVHTVINAAAYNFVDRAEDEPDAAWVVNARGPRLLAQWCAANAATCVHISTDHVFGLDGSRSIPFRETDAPGPVSAYGISKLAGEHFVRSTAPRHFVLRTCGLYGHPPAGGKGNFVETMLRLGKGKGEVKVVNDQYCTPTSAADLAEMILALIRTNAFGLYHATSSGATTWHEFAQEIFRQSGTDARVIPISTQEFGAKARRPAYSVLDCSKLAAAAGISIRDWRESLAGYLS